MNGDPYLCILAPSLRGYVAVRWDWTTLYTEVLFIHSTISNFYFRTSSCADMYHTPAERTPITIKAMVVFLFHCLGLHHQPPEGDHTYSGY